MRRSPWGWLFLAAAVGYVALHGLAAVLGIPPSLFFSAVFQSLGFLAGLVVLLVLVLQLIRR